MSKKITALINKRSGKVTLTPEGFTGSECQAATEALENGLGMSPENRELTNEYYKEAKQENTQST